MVRLCRRCQIRMIAHQQMQNAVHNEVSFIKICHIGRVVTQNVIKLRNCPGVMQESILHWLRL